MLYLFSDEHFMGEALKEAQKAAEVGEVPVGAVVVSENRIIARAHNQTEQLNDVTAHAEMLAITAAANHYGNKYLDNCTLYVTLEPCPMCAGALQLAQLGGLVWAADDPKGGFRTKSNVLHPKTSVKREIRQQESLVLLQNFFKERRK